MQQGLLSSLVDPVHTCTLPLSQDLQARLTEEINRMRSLVTGQGLEGIADANRERKSCELEVRVKKEKKTVQV